MIDPPILVDNKRLSAVLTYYPLNDPRILRALAGKIGLSNCPMDTQSIATRRKATPKYPSAKNGGKLHLKTLTTLDGRTLAARTAKQLVMRIESDLGGDLTAAQQQLVQNAATLSAMIESDATAWLAGETIDKNAFSTLINSQRRVLRDLGIKRVPRNVSAPSLDDIAREIEAEKDDAT